MPSYDFSFKKQINKFVNNNARKSEADSKPSPKSNSKDQNKTKDVKEKRKCKVNEEGMSIVEDKNNSTKHDAKTRDSEVPNELMVVEPMDSMLQSQPTRCVKVESGGHPAKKSLRNRNLLCVGRRRKKEHCQWAKSYSYHIDYQELQSLENLAEEETVIEKVHSPLTYVMAKRKSSKKGVSLLPPIEDCDSNKMCLVVDLDETLVHSSFKPLPKPSFKIDINLDGMMHTVFVMKRPYVDSFIKKIGQLFECVLFTASLSKYADPVTDILDPQGVFKHRLFREHCTYQKGCYIKDLSRLGRDVNRCSIIDNYPSSYLFHPRHAVPVISWFDDESDRALKDLQPYFEAMSRSPTVTEFILSRRAPNTATAGYWPLDYLESDGSERHKKTSRLPPSRRSSLALARKDSNVDYDIGSLVTQVTRHEDPKPDSESEASGSHSGSGGGKRYLVRKKSNVKIVKRETSKDHYESDTDKRQIGTRYSSSLQSSTTGRSSHSVSRSRTEDTSSVSQAAGGSEPVRLVTADREDMLHSRQLSKKSSKGPPLVSKQSHSFQKRSPSAKRTESVKPAQHR